MRTLTENQKQFLISFFEDDRYAGWRGIATKLVETGSCIVAGDECIWNRGHIGNFITTKETDLAVGCLEYNFDLDSFLSSAWFKENLEYGIAEVEIRLERKKKELKETEDKLNELNVLL